MLCALNFCRDAGNIHLSIDSGYDNYSCINFPIRQSLNQVDSSTDLLEKVITTEVITQSTKNQGL